ncbi:hypothetical protein [Aquibacillus kalidii]|uniref:hypothetical protein n=1 Tax=Aquibacillus kalidii TaxID=2762597 RepID=UPI0016452EB3|nr:hypothetical protein [Aquibacillus kalidii]
MEFYNAQQFQENLSTDKELKESLVILDKFLGNQQFLSKMRFLSRQVYLAQYNIDLFKIEDGVGSYMPESQVIKLGELINDIVVEFGGSDYINAYRDVINIVRKYYQHTASRDEYNSRIMKTEPSGDKRKFGFHGTLYNFNELDWETFENYLANKMDYEYMKASD